MFLITEMIKAIGLVVGSLVVSGVLCWIAAGAAERLHHRNWAAFLVLIALSFLFLSGMTQSSFVKLVAAYGVVGALVLFFLPDQPIKKPDKKIRGGK